MARPEGVTTPRPAFWSEWATLRVELGVNVGWTPTGPQWGRGRWSFAQWGAAYRPDWLDVTDSVVSFDCDSGRGGAMDPGDAGQASLVVSDPLGHWGIAGSDKFAQGHLVRAFALARAGDRDRYERQVRASAPNAWLPFGEAYGDTAHDVAGDRDGTYRRPGLELGAPGIPGSTSTAVALEGEISGGVTFDGPNPGRNLFTVELWARTYRAGWLWQFASVPETNGGATWDRMAWIDAAGHFHFATYPGRDAHLVSPRTYIDGAWHHFAATVGPAGTIAWADGERIGRDPATTAQAFSGWWRVGCGQGSAYWGNANVIGFAGELAHAAFYDRQLLDDELETHFDAGRHAAPDLKVAPLFFGKIVAARAVGDLTAPATSVNCIDALGTALGLDDPHDAPFLDFASQRLHALLDRVFWPNELRDIQQDGTLVGPVEVRNLLDEARRTTASTGGTLWGAGDGKITYRTRDFTIPENPVASLEIGTQGGDEVASPGRLELSEDMARLFNIVRLENIYEGNEKVTVERFDPKSIERFGRHALEARDLTTVQPSALDTIAARRLSLMYLPLERVDPLELEVHDEATARAATLKVGDLVHVTYTGADPWSRLMFVGGTVHRVTPDAWQVALRCFDPISLLAGYAPRWGQGKWALARWQ